MGTNMGSSFANLFIAFVVQKFFEQFTGHVSALLLQYISHIFGIANCTGEKLQLFISSFSTFHLALEYTWSIAHPSLSISLLQGCI